MCRVQSLAAAMLLASAGLPGPAGALPEVPPPLELPPRLDLDRALALVRERGLDLLVAEAAVHGAEGDLAAAGAIPNPTLGLGYGRSFLTGRCTNEVGAEVACPSYPPAYSASLSDGGAVFDSLTGKRGLRTRVAREALAAARLSRDDALRSLAAQVEQRFVEAVLGTQSLQFAREVAAAQARTVELTQARYDAGAISEADLARVQTARLEADQAVDRAQADLRTARVALAFLLGVRGPVPDFEVVPGELGRSTAPARLAAETRESLIARALQSRPDVLAARRQTERARAAVDLARRLRFPDVTLSASYAQEGNTPTAVTPPTWSVGVSVPLPIFYRQRGEIEKAEADRLTQSLTVAKAEGTAVSDVESAWAAYEASRALVQRMEKGGLLERSRTAFDLVTIQYRKGAASLLDLLDAQRTWIATRLEYLQDMAGYWQAIFRLEQATGASLR
ncbi:TolC family protein [Anaeromyxobacter oryzisoli]|uniref:TolC family protein n=1 Tax=Anaeromyxobacter oryzisoli TaxID=2925408 RepID=UPI001F5AF080|nr:TolC family protein [Anaeromyxobacter sp. SG63]